MNMLSSLGRIRTALLLLLGVIAALAGSISAARAGDGIIAGFVPGAGLVSIPVVSLNGEHFFGIVRQHTDYSCGAASVATILKYAYGRDENESDVIVGMLRVSDPAIVRRNGFSLLDIKHYVASIGMVGAGYRVTPAELYRFVVPTIVLLNVRGYEHFVVLKKSTPQYTYVADPIRGNLTLPTPEFLQSWDGIVFVIAAGSYERANVLVSDLHAPASLRRMAAGIPTNLNALADAVLSTVYIPGIDRL